MANKDVKRELEQLMKGRTEEQKNALKYFYQYKGCIFGHLMTDQEYEQMVVKMINSTDWKKKALAKIGMEEEDVQEVRPIHFEGFDYTPKHSLSLYGKDMKWRSSHYQISWVFCSATQVYVWQYTFSTTKAELYRWLRESVLRISSSLPMILVLSVPTILRRQMRPETPRSSGIRSNICP